MALTRKKKDSLIKEVGEKAQDASLLVLTSFEGIDVETDTDLRREIRKTGAHYQVLKNTLAKRVWAGDEYAEIHPHMKGMTGYVLGGEDPVATAKALTEFAKAKPKMFALKTGFFEGQVLSLEQIEELAKIPSRPELLSRLAGAFQAPITKLANVLQAPIQKLAGTLQALADKKTENE